MTRLWTLLAFAISLFLTGCGKPVEPPAESNPDGPLNVVCTIGMISDLATHIGGDHVAVTPMMGPGVDPHLYKPTMGDSKAIRAADVVFYNGLHLEAKMGDLFKDMSARKTVKAVTDTVPKDKLLPSPDYEGQFDPHLWFDVTLWMHAAETIRDTLIEKDPKNAETYRSNAEAYLAEMEKLNRYATVQLNRIPKQQRVLITAHDAFGYFGKSYGFTVKGLQGISTVAEAGIKDVQEIVNYIVDNKIRAVFIESSVPKRNIEAVQQAAKDKGWDLTIGGELFSDAMGDWGTPEGTYLGMVRHNVDTITAALLGEPND